MKKNEKTKFHSYNTSHALSVMSWSVTCFAKLLLLLFVCPSSVLSIHHNTKIIINYVLQSVVFDPFYISHILTNDNSVTHLQFHIWLNFSTCL